MIAGSHLYGTATEFSDKDRCGIMGILYGYAEREYNQ